MNTTRTLMLAGAFLAASFAASTQALAAPGQGGGRDRAGLSRRESAPARHETIVAPQPRRHGFPSRGHRRPFARGHYEIRTERVLVECGHYEWVHVPAVTRVVRGRFGRLRTIVIEPARARRVWVPARYETRRYRVWVPHDYHIARGRRHGHGSVINGVLRRAGIVLGGRIRF